MKDGSLYVWGKNDRGQLGVGTGIGIDMIESENVPVLVPVIDSKNKPHLVKDFVPGLYTMMIRDEDDNIYKVGMRLDYTPKEINIFGEDFKKEDVKQLHCGRKHYLVLNKDNQMMVWGNIFKEKPAVQRDGFGLYFGDSLFNGGKIRDMSIKYSIFGALVEH
jgi:alpha-tubulin suppressor-like RCC1 family protein